MSKKKFVAILGGALLLTGTGAIVRQRVVTQQAASAVQTAKATRTDFVKTAAASGKTKAERSVDLQFQTSGMLSWINVKEGSTVSAYQAVAGLDPREVQKTLEKDLIDYSEQRNTFEDTRKYTTQANNPGEAVSEAMKHLLEKNQWDLTKAVLDVELDHLAVEYATLITPISGVVTHIDAPVAGVNVTPAGSTITVADPASMVFEANVDETDVGNLALGQIAHIALDAYPDATFSGTISYISYASVLSAGGATVFPVRIRFDDPGSVRIGLNGDVTIDSVNLPSALSIPIEALREENGTKYVYKKVGKTYQKTPVVTGMQNDASIVIQSGLAEGDEVVIKGFNALPKS